MVTKTFANWKIELESRIQSIIEEDNYHFSTVHFQYNPGTDNGIDLSVITHNPAHHTDFLLHKTWGVSEEAALQNALEFISNHRKNENTYTVEWQQKGKTLSTSYFSGNDIYSVLNKFYHDKNHDDFIIFSIKLNPLS